MSTSIRSRVGTVLIASLAVLAFSDDVFADKKTGKTSNVPPGKPEIFSLEPRGVQRGSTNRIKLVGTNLLELTELKLSHPKLSGQVLNEPEPTTNVAWIELTVPADLARGPYELSVKNTNAE